MNNANFEHKKTASSCETASFSITKIYEIYYCLMKRFVVVPFSLPI